MPHNKLNKAYFSASNDYKNHLRNDTWVEERSTTAECPDGASVGRTTTYPGTKLFPLNLEIRAGRSSSRHCSALDLFKC